MALIISILAGTLSLPTTLYDLPVSNHGARVRLLLYKRGLESAVRVASPMELGGLRGEKYLSLNPQGKMPLLVDGDSCVWETDAICRHLLEKHAAEGDGPSLFPTSLAARTAAEVIVRHHDTYIGPIQGCLYKPAPPFGRFTSRRDALQELVKQLAVVEALADPTGPYLAGEEFSLADATLFPTMVFITHMLPKFEDAVASPAGEAGPRLGPRLSAWWSHTSNADEAAKRVADEIRSGLQPWEERGRWDAMLYAGARDVAPATLFDKILSKEIPSEVVFEDALCLAFRDINPVAPAHILIIPKHRDGLTGLGAATAEHSAILGHLMVAAAAIAKQEGLSEFRLVTNNGEGAGQSVFHLHLHLIGGRPLEWPPG